MRPARRSARISGMGANGALITGDGIRARAGNQGARARCPVIRPSPIPSPLRALRRSPPFVTLSAAQRSRTGLAVMPCFPFRFPGPARHLVGHSLGDGPSPTDEGGSPEPVEGATAGPAAPRRIVYEPREGRLYSSHGREPVETNGNGTSIFLSSYSRSPVGAIERISAPAPGGRTPFNIQSPRRGSDGKKRKGSLGFSVPRARARG